MSHPNKQSIAETQFEVIGGEIIGEKAEMLRGHQVLIEEVGLQIPPTTVIASETVRATELSGPVPNTATQDGLKIISGKYGSSPVLAIRSSAEGDASGNGVYESRFATNVPDLVLKEAGVVIEDFSSDSARDFRNQAGLGEAFALMVQPVIGQDLGSSEYWERFGPYLSGFGYSSSGVYPNGYINVVAGIGGGVSRSGGQIVTPETLEDIVDMTIRIKYKKEEGVPLSFHQFLEAIHEAIIGDHMDFTLNDFRTGDSIFPREFVEQEAALAQYLLRKRGDAEYSYDASGLLEAGIHEYSGKDDKDGRPKFDFVESGLTSTTRKFMPDKLLEAMQRMEQVAGYPVYVEWALDVSRGEPQPVILQIAPAIQTTRAKLEAEIQGSVIAESRLLAGDGVREAHKIVVIAGPDDVEHLAEFNRDPQNEGYILLFSSALSSSKSMTQLQYSDCSKAAALVEIAAPDVLYRHANGDIVEHLFGASRQTNKLVGEVTGNTGDVHNLWQRVHEAGTEWRSEEERVLRFSKHGVLMVLDGKFKVYADPSTDRLAITE